MVYIGAENILSPLGKTAKANFDSILAGKTGLNLVEKAGNRDEALYISVFKELEATNINQLTISSIQRSIVQVEEKILKNSERTILILSTTKGEINLLKQGLTEEAALDHFKTKISVLFPWIQKTILVSNACISGVMAQTLGHDLIEANETDHVIVCGVDVLSEFTLAGFQSFFALSEAPCKPFDKDRSGINLGEGAATVILSKDKSLFELPPLKCLGGSSANDANHISGPSRTGEGLFRSITKSLNHASLKAQDIDFLSAHGTGTLFNDEMESIAFERAGLINTPLHSLKGSFGHTFGAAGVIESVICLQSIRNNQMIASTGFQQNGTTKKINVLKNHQQKELTTVLKTASGFGGCNASIVFQK